MVTIRMVLRGAKKRPFYHIVVTNNRNARNGKFIEKIGFFSPFKTSNRIVINLNKVKYWIEKGAKISNRVSKIIKEIKN